MDKAKNLEQLAKLYNQLMIAIAMDNDSRARALSKNIVPYFYSDMLPGKNFECVPLSCVDDFIIIKKWMKGIDRKRSKQIAKEVANKLESEVTINNRITPSYIVSNMHFSHSIKEVINAIFNITLELNYLSQLTEEERNKQITYVPISNLL